MTDSSVYNLISVLHTIPALLTICYHLKRIWFSVLLADFLPNDIARVRNDGLVEIWRHLKSTFYPLFL